MKADGIMVKDYDVWNCYEMTVASLAIKQDDKEHYRFVRDLVNKKKPFSFDELPESTIDWFVPDPSRMFLPFPDIWIEAPAIAGEHKGRMQLVISKGTELCYIFTIKEGDNLRSSYQEGSVLVEDDEVIVSLKDSDDSLMVERMLKFFLHHINYPHHGLYQTRRFSLTTRIKAQKAKLYPLAAVTEILIKQIPLPPRVITETGEGARKAQHEVRAHKRIYHRGTPYEFEVLVHAHTRGDPKLGIRKSKYKVET